MPPETKTLHHEFAAELIGLDITEPVTDEVRDFVEGAMAQYGVVALRGQTRANDADHLRFARAFGPLELPPELGLFKNGRPKRIARELFDMSNLLENGELDTPGSLKYQFSKGNEVFHSDGSFHDLPTKWTMLLAYELPPEGGHTEFVDLRVAYERLPEAMREELEELQIENSLAYSRAKARMTDVDVYERTFPPVVQPLVRESASGRKTLNIGTYTRQIFGMEEERSRALIDDLLAHATQPEHVFTYRWQPGDMVIWDNRCTMHRGTEYDYANHRRDLRRAVINEYGEERTASTA